LSFGALFGNVMQLGQSGYCWGSFMFLRKVRVSLLMSLLTYEHCWHRSSSKTTLICVIWWVLLREFIPFGELALLRKTRWRKPLEHHYCVILYEVMIAICIEMLFYY